MINIERNILCSVLEHNFIDNDKKIIDEVLEYSIFSKEHQLFVKSIKRLKELDEPVDADTIRLKLQEANKWDFYLEESLLKIISSNPFESYEIFKSYLDLLEKQAVDKKKQNAIMYI